MTDWYKIMDHLESTYGSDLHCYQAMGKVWFVDYDAPYDPLMFQQGIADCYEECINRIRHRRL